MTAAHDLVRVLQFFVLRRFVVSELLQLMWINSRGFGVIFLALLISAPTAGYTEDHRITSEMVKVALEHQGYQVVMVTRTLLGRMRFVASREQVWREIILDNSSGQVLRDYAVEFTAPRIPAEGQDGMPRGGTLITTEPLLEFIN